MIYLGVLWIILMLLVLFAGLYRLFCPLKMGRPK